MFPIFITLVNIRLIFRKPRLFSIKFRNAFTIIIRSMSRQIIVETRNFLNIITL